MVKFLRVIILGGAVATSIPNGSAMAVDSTEGKDTVIDSQKDINVSASELQSLKEAALNGSIAAADRLGMYYGAIVLNKKEEIFWTTIAAENGDSGARYLLALRLSNSSDRLDRIRARYWFQRIIAEGPHDQIARAMSGLKNLDAIEAGNARHQP